MKKYLMLIVLVAVFGLMSATAHAVSTKWLDKNTTLMIDNTLMISKPNTQWDTQTKGYEDSAPIKWVRHVAGANPQMFLRYKPNVTGKTAHVYSQQVKSELSSRGINVYKTEKKVVNGRNVAILYGSKGEEEYMVGVWRHKDLGFQLECLAVKDKFNSYMSDFYAAINSVRIVKESGL
ncbi:MAG: hypothetical protein ABII18_01280 [bacterium]|nr:hypothetical protein [bacterium]MBU1917289.1 hypothetical protein [bacterium]